MEQNQPDTKQRILHAAYQLFYRQGFTRVSVDAIAGRAGVTKRTVYYHFDSKDDIVAGVLKVQHLHLMSQYKTWLEHSPDSASEVVVDLFSRLKTWTDGPDWLGSGFSRITAELADMHGHPARHAASRHKALVEAWLAERLAGTGVSEAALLASQIMVLIEGGMSLALVHSDTGYINTAMNAAKRLVEAAVP